jgi:3-dehydroquinate synthase
VDENTHRFCFSKFSDFKGYDFVPVLIKSGENHKTIESCMHVWGELMAHKADKDSLLINLGGGVVSDLGGFVASTYKRGIRFINIPTSLLAISDASIGGKTGVDFLGHKNMVGTISFPEAVFVYPDFLTSLSVHEWRSGIVESLKHGLIADKKFWCRLSEVHFNEIKDFYDYFSIRNLHDLLMQSAGIKSTIVSVDPTEKNERKLLNFGHTIGHAIETWYLLNSIKSVNHGEAVSNGIICEAWISTKLSGLDANEFNKIVDVMKTVFPPLKIPKESFSQILSIMRNDKKNSGGSINCILLKSIGAAQIVNDIPDEILLESLHYLTGL